MNVNKIEVTIISVLLLLITALITAASYRSCTEQSTEQDSVTVKLEQPEFFLYDYPNKELLYQACEYYDIHHADIVVAQAVLESGWFSSENCLNNCNLFGLYNSRKQEYFKFDHWTESVKAYKDYIQSKYINGDYYSFLDSLGYAEDTCYNEKLREVLSCCL